MATRQTTNPRHWIAEWAVTFLLYLFGTASVLQAVVVPTGSMEATVLIGDHLFIDKLAYAPAGPVGRLLLPYQDVRRGDIIVFRYPLDMREPYVKRAIGIPGDRIRMTSGRLYVNGTPVDEPYKVLQANPFSTYLREFPSQPDVRIDTRAMIMLRDHVRDGELVVPEGQYFALGDNRDNSADSRFWGLVPRENIVGKPVMIWWSYDAPTERLSDGNIRPDHIADLAMNFFSKTRWNRTFRMVRGHPIP